MAVGRIVTGALREMGLDEGAAGWGLAAIKVLVSHQRCYETCTAEGRPDQAKGHPDMQGRGRSSSGDSRPEGVPERQRSGRLQSEGSPVEMKRAYRLLEAWFQDGDVQQFLQVNRYHNVLWFNREAFDQMLGWTLTVAVIETAANPLCGADEVVEEIVGCYDVVQRLQQAEEASGYQVEKLLDLVKG